MRLIAVYLRHDMRPVQDGLQRLGFDIARIVEFLQPDVRVGERQVFVVVVFVLEYVHGVQNKDEITKGDKCQTGEEVVL